MVVVLGWIGSILYLVNHGYISVVKNWNTKVYYSGNLLAAVSLVVSSLIISSFQAVVINGFWAVISILLLCSVNIEKVPLSKRLFYIGFIAIVALCMITGWRDGFQSTSFFTSLGWSSSYVFCLTYFLFCSKKMSHIHYLIFNVYAATALLPILWGQENYPVLTLEICWAAISAYGIYTRVDSVHLID